MTFSSPNNDSWDTFFESPRVPWLLLSQVNPKNLLQPYVDSAAFDEDVHSAYNAWSSGNEQSIRDQRSIRYPQSAMRTPMPLTKEERQGMYEKLLSSLATLLKSALDQLPPGSGRVRSTGNPHEEPWTSLTATRNSPHTTAAGRPQTTLFPSISNTPAPIGANISSPCDSGIQNSPFSPTDDRQTASSITSPLSTVSHDDTHSWKDRARNLTPRPHDRPHNPFPPFRRSPPAAAPPPPPSSQPPLPQPSSNSDAGRRRKRASGPQTLACPEEGCTKTFRYKSKLDDHIHSHRKDKNLPCRRCSKMFKRQREVDAHEKAVHKTADEQSPSENGQPRHRSESDPDAMEIDPIPPSTHPPPPPPLPAGDPESEMADGGLRLPPIKDNASKDPSDQTLDNYHVNVLFNIYTP